MALCRVFTQPKLEFLGGYGIIKVDMRPNKLKYNQKNSKTARAITGDKYEPPLRITVLGFRISIPRWIVNTFARNRAGSTSRALVETFDASLTASNSLAPTLPSGEGGYVGITATSSQAAMNDILAMGPEIHPFWKAFGMALTALALLATKSFVVGAVVVIAAVLVFRYFLNLTRTQADALGIEISFQMGLTDIGMLAIATGQAFASDVGVLNPGQGLGGTGGNTGNTNEITDILNRHTFGECVVAAAAVSSELNRRGIRHQIIRLEWSIRRYVFSNSLERAGVILTDAQYAGVVSDLGFHVGISIIVSGNPASTDPTFCNAHSTGLTLTNWINDFDGPGILTITPSEYRRFRTR